MFYRFGRFEVDEAAFRLSVDGEPVSLEPRVLRLLLYLIENRTRLVRKQELLDAVWQDTAVTENALTRCVGLLRKALGDDSREPYCIETVPTIGYRFIAPVVSTSSAEVPVSARETVPETPPLVPTPATPFPARPTTHGARRTGLFYASAVVVTVLIAMGWFFQRRLHAAASIHSLAVLPFDNLSGDPTQDYFADGTTDELITDLARIPSLRVVSRTSAHAERRQSKSLPEIARDLNVEAVVEGSVARYGTRVRVTAQLIDARTDRHLWAQSFEADSADVLALQDMIAAEIAAQAQSVLDLSASAQRASIPGAALDDYLRARYFFNKQDFGRSDEYYQKAIAAAPNYAAAYAGLASALDAESAFGVLPTQDAMPHAVAAARRAIALDPTNAEALSELGSVETIYEWNWPDAELNLTRAIAVSPSDSVAEFKYSVFLDANGHTADAVSHMRRAVSLDPLSFFMNRRLGAALYLNRQYDEAIKQLGRASEMEPSQANTFDNYISRAYQMKGLRDQAIANDLRSLNAGPNALDAFTLSSLSTVYKHDGWKAYWIARATGSGPISSEGCGVYETAIEWLNAGEAARAIQSLNVAIDRRCVAVVQIKTDPRLDPIRNSVNYSALLARIHLSAN